MKPEPYSTYRQERTLYLNWFLLSLISMLFRLLLLISGERGLISEGMV